MATIDYRVTKTTNRNFRSRADILGARLDKYVKTEYNYLLNLSVYSFTLEKVEELENDIEKLQKELEIIVNTEEKDIWIRELDAFEQMYKKN